jgi:flagellar basal-body rod protein FlgB
VDTPGYVRQDVRFHKILSEAVESGRMERIKEARPEVYYDTATPSRPDGNNVSTQKELGEMMQNELLYQFSSKALSSVYGGLLKAIKGK